MTNTRREQQKICIIGDSHTGAFKLGWDSIKAEFPDIEVTFFAIGRGGMKHIKSQGSRLYFKRANLVERLERLGFPTEIDVSEYDAFLGVGLMNLLQPLVLFQREHSLLKQTDTGKKQLVSEEMYIETWQEQFCSSPIKNVLSALESAGAKNAYVFFKPLISSEILKRSSPVSKIYSELMDDPITRKQLWSIVERGMKDVLGEVTYIPQPAETTIDGLMTQDRYSTGSTRLRSDQEKHDDEDIKHMNGDFGAVCLRTALRAIYTNEAQI